MSAVLLNVSLFENFINLLCYPWHLDSKFKRYILELTISIAVQMPGWQGRLS
jgi:hypothetical protein